MTVYQCLNCRKYYGDHPNKKVNKHLKKIDMSTYQRYLDSDVWRCPNCNQIQDTRDIQSFMGIGGNGMLKQLTELEIGVIFLGYVPPDDSFDYMY